MNKTKEKMKIYKYATGDEIPKGAVYLSTEVQFRESAPFTWLVWHYFLVCIPQHE